MNDTPALYIKTKGNQAATLSRWEDETGVEIYPASGEGPGLFQVFGNDEQIRQLEHLLQLYLHEGGDEITRWD